MISYEIKTPTFDNSKGVVRKTGFEFKTVSKSELKLYLDKDWVLHRKKYFLITSFLDWFKKLSDSEKIAFFALVIPSVIAIIFGILAHRSNENNRLINNKLDSIKTRTLNLEKSNRLFKEQINTLNKKLDTISQKQQPKTSTDKN